MLKRFYYSLLLLLTGVGFWALGVRFMDGMNVTNLTSYFSWGLWVVFYIFFIGLSAGSFLLSTMIYVFKMHALEKVGRISLLSALISLVAGLMFVLIDLGHPERFWHTLVYRNMSSVLEWEIHFYLLYILLVLGELWLVMRDDLSAMSLNQIGIRRILGKVLSLGYRTSPTSEGRTQQIHTAERWVRILGMIGIPMAIGVHGGTGSIFAVQIAKPFWNNSIVPIIFIVSALVSGSALVTFLYAFFGKKDSDKPNVLASLTNLLILFIGVDLILVLAEFLVGLYSGIPEDMHSLKAVVTGQYGLIFWLGQIGMAAILPILLIRLSRINGSEVMKGLAGLSTVIGIIAVRINLVLPAYVSPQIPGLENAYVDSRLVYDYFPSSIEILSTLGIIAFVVLLFSIAWELLPIVSNNDPKTSGRRTENYGIDTKGTTHTA
ncbi:NrfD/PsrC family molybdoenzyme membrane anchor subunit [Desulfosporosinus nitroreducens]|uniref:NrfD/PsrC family molybdoenzyme membrane anchor subunit n=1 Tax=Desulfosporosinus nitroreducens TaxID=2018668 RepID=UPI00207D46A9|nr:NrfD/PsrC family molybdoenzyme membrane anchor subunit [Desulfosporosinus nitroreducens]MCO1600213.1 polysulfide reductase NrfD [Desulfosporosinus nitroreducens]